MESLASSTSLIPRLHEAGRGRIRAAHDVRIHLRAADGVEIRQRCLDVAHRAHPGHDLSAVGFVEPFLGNGPGSDTADGLAGTGAAATAGGTGAVLHHLVGEIRVRGPGNAAHLAIVMGPLILVVYQQHDRRAQGLAELGAGVDGHLVGLLAGRGEIGLAGAAAGKLFLDISLDQGHPGGQPSTMAPTPLQWDSPKVVTV